MNVLVLGGTQFIGRAIVEELFKRGHSVAIFHRGKTGAGLFPEATHILGDRNTDLAKADTQEWDAVVDVSCYIPDQARSAAKLRTKYFAFISTVSVYDEKDVEGPMTEESKIQPAEEGTEVTGASYGPMKVRCEEVLQEAFGDRLGIIRPGIVFGPHDPTGRFPYWVTRLDQYEEVLMPDKLGQQNQWIDVQDLAEFTVDQVEKKAHGVWNAVGPRATFGDIIEEIRRQVAKEHHLTFATMAELEEIGVKPWADLPLIFPQDWRSLFDFDPKHAVAAGLKHRSLEETTKSTLAWTRSDEFPGLTKGGMTREAELEALGKLKAKV